MTDLEVTTAPATATDAQPVARLSASALHCDLQALFQNSSPRRAIQAALMRIGEYAGASYAVVHARIGVQNLSEEWSSEQLDLDDPLRQTVNTIMWDAMSVGTAKCVRMRQPGQPAAAVATAVLYDETFEEAGAAAIVIHDCEHERAMDVLSWFEGIIGYLALLVARHSVAEAGSSSTSSTVAATRLSSAAEHPVRLAMEMAAELKNRHDLDMTAIGFVNRSRVKVVAISGMDEVRPADPGVTRIRAAMEECLDFREAVLCGGVFAEGDGKVECRLHEQWSASSGGFAVASFPLFAADEIVAIVSVTGSSSNALRSGELQDFAADMADYATLVPLSRDASRGLLTHAVSRVRGITRRITGRRRTLLATLGGVALCGWLIFGELPYSLTVPCFVEATEHRTVPSPREGVLSELFAKPGDIVRQGQLLAILDAHEDMLERDRLQAEIATMQAKSDQALADGEAGEGRILAAQQQSLRAQLAAVERSIKQAEIRAPQAGVILRGDLRERLGGRLSLGDPLFEMARDDRMVVKLRIAENSVLDARESVTATFAPAARPGDTFELREVRIEPSSTIHEGKNVFLGESATNARLGKLAPGMEGVGYLELKPRNAWWVLTHRVTDWLRLNFWL